MNRFLAWLRPAPTQPRQPGRHSAEWAAMVQARDAAQARCRTLEAACDTYRQELADAEEQFAAAEERFTASAQGWEDALNFSSEEYIKLQQQCAEQARELESLRSLLAASDGSPVQHVPSPIQQGCCNTPHANDVTVQASLADLEREGDKPFLDLLAGLTAAKGLKPPLRNEVTQELVRPLHQSPAAEVSPTTGERARESVHAAVGTP